MCGGDDVYLKRSISIQTSDGDYRRVVRDSGFSELGRLTSVGDPSSPFS